MTYSVPPLPPKPKTAYKRCKSCGASEPDNDKCAYCGSQLEATKRAKRNTFSGQYKRDYLSPFYGLTNSTGPL